MTKKNSSLQARQANRWYHQSKWAALIVPLALLGAYGMASLAINSGSLLQYFAAIVLICLAVNRMAHLVLLAFSKRAA